VIYEWILPGKLAQAPMPRLSDIGEIARYFTGVVVLLEPSDIPPYYIDSLIGHGLDVLHVPVRDFHPIELLDLMEISLFIEKHVERGGAVLVHCMGGVGRSGMATASYLVFKGYSTYEAIMHVRSIVPGAVENHWQARMIGVYELLLRILRRTGMLDYIARRITATPVSILRHLSKVLQFHIELHDPLYVNAPCMDEGVRQALERYLSGERVVNEASGELCVPEALDYDYSGRVIALYIDTVDKPVITLLCDSDCSDIAEKASMCRGHVEELLGGRPVFNWGYYMDYA